MVDELLSEGSDRFSHVVVNMASVKFEQMIMQIREEKSQKKRTVPGLLTGI